MESFTHHPLFSINFEFRLRLAAWFHPKHLKTGPPSATIPPLTAGEPSPQPSRSAPTAQSPAAKNGRLPHFPLVPKALN
jgi:hypothetical protein